MGLMLEGSEVWGRSHMDGRKQKTLDFFRKQSRSLSVSQKSSLGTEAGFLRRNLWVEARGKAPRILGESGEACKTGDKLLALQERLAAFRHQSCTW